MTITSFSSGVNTSFSSELNSNFSLVSKHRSAMVEDTTDYSALCTNNSWVDIGFSKTFTCPDTHHILTGIKIVGDSTGSTTPLFRIKITNNDTSAYFYVVNKALLYNGNQRQTYLFTGGTAYGKLESINGDSANGQFYLISDEFSYFIDASSYTITIEANNRNPGTNTQHLKNITLTIYWDYFSPPTTEGWS